MNTTQSTTVQRLRANQFVSIRRPRALCLRAERGTLWVTVDGQFGDIVLEPGQHRVFSGPHTVVVGSLGGQSVFSLTPVGPAAWPERLLIWLGLGALPVAGWAR